MTTTAAPLALVRFRWTDDPGARPAYLHRDHSGTTANQREARRLSLEEAREFAKRENVFGRGCVPPSTCRASVVKLRPRPDDGSLYVVKRRSIHTPTDIYIGAPVGCALLSWTTDRKRALRLSKKSATRLARCFSPQPHPTRLARVKGTGRREARKERNPFAGVLFGALAGAASAYLSEKLHNPKPAAP